jgi:hypothetical protein
VRTTLLNPTIWLLAALLVRAAWALVRDESPRDALTGTLRLAARWPVLVVLTVATMGALGSRVVIGYLSPGAYAEEVIAARSFLAERQLYTGDDRAEFTRWANEERSPANPWTLPGLSTCQASAFEHRPQFYTSQAHTPMLLLGSVPLVRVFGGHGLYVTLVVLSAALLTAAWWMLASEHDVAAIPGGMLLSGVALAGWQPVVAGLRQGDAVIVAASLIVIAWALLRREQPLAAGALAGLAAALSLPAALCVLALVRWPRAFAGACLSSGVAVMAALAVGGPMMFVDFAGNVADAARTYAVAMPNYAFVGRLAGSQAAVSRWWIAVIAALVIGGWWKARSVDDAFAWFAGLALLAAPLAWSQHVTLALLPLVWVLRRVSGHGSLGLVGWSLLALAVSLPDPAVAIIGDHLPLVGGIAWPIVPVALGCLWTWLAVASWTRRSAVSEATALP